MVKGVSRQVIVVHAPDPKLFDQAIFILREDVVDSGGVTDEKLLQEANRIIALPNNRKRRWNVLGCVMWASAGALLTAAAWVLTAFF